MNEVWQVGDVKIVRVVELEVTGGSRFIPDPRPPPLNPSYRFTESSDLRVQRGRGGHVDDARRAASNVTAASLVGRQLRLSGKFPRVSERSSSSYS